MLFAPRVAPRAYPKQFTACRYLVKIHCPSGSICEDAQSLIGSVRCLERDEEDGRSRDERAANAERQNSVIANWQRELLEL